MTVPLVFDYPGEWIELDLEHEAGGVVAAQTALGRAGRPVSRELAVDMEARFGALIDLMRRADVQLGFALTPPFPSVGLQSWLAVRWYPAPGDDAIEDLIRDTVPPDRELLIGPVRRTETTPLGLATVAIHRYATGPAEPHGLLRRPRVPITEHVRWSWIVEDPGGPDLLVTVFTLNDRLEYAPQLRALVAGFARGIRVGS